MNNKFRLLVAVAALALPGCKDRATSVVEQYLNQPLCVDRAQFVLDPSANINRMAVHYRNEQHCKTEHEKIDASSCKNVPVGSYCYVSVEKVRDVYCVKRVAQDDFKIDWPCSVGWNEKPIKVVKADLPGPESPVVLRVKAVLDDYYPSEMSRENTISVRISDSTDSDVAFMDYRRVLGASKKSTTYENAEKFKQLLSDGKPHKVILELSYLEGKDHGPSAIISWVLQEGWESIPDDRLETLRKERRTLASAWLQPGREDAEKLRPCCDALSDLGRTAKESFTQVLALRAAETCRDEQTLVSRGDETLEAAAAKVARWGGESLPLPAACTSVK